MGPDLIPLSIKSSTYENSTELDRKCPTPAASSIAIKCAIKWRPADRLILSLEKRVAEPEKTAPDSTDSRPKRGLAGPTLWPVLRAPDFPPAPDSYQNMTDGRYLHEANDSQSRLSVRGITT